MGLEKLDLGRIICIMIYRELLLWQRGRAGGVMTKPEKQERETNTNVTQSRRQQDEVF